MECGKDGRELDPEGEERREIMSRLFPNYSLCQRKETTTVHEELMSM